MEIYKPRLQGLCYSDLRENLLVRGILMTGNLGSCCYGSLLLMVHPNGYYYFPTAYKTTEFLYHVLIQIPECFIQIPE